MNALYQKLKTSGAHGAPLTDEILKVCNKAHPGAWMARLERFRNLIVHEAPIRKLSQDTFLIAHPVDVEGRTLPSIYVGVPTNPFASDGTFVDALAHFRWLMLRLLDFSKLVIASSPIWPSIPHFSDADLRT